MKKLLFVLWMVIGSFAAQKTEQVVIMTEDFPPNQYMMDGELRGITVTIVRELMRRLGYEPEITVVGWNAGYQKILDKSNKNHGLFATVRTEEREKLFKWVGPLLDAETILFKKKGNPFDCETLDDAKKAKAIGVSLNFADHLFLKNRGFRNLVVNRDPKHTENLKLLVYNRVELISSQEDRILISALNDEVEPDLIVKTNCTLFNKQNAIAFSLGTSDALIRRWQKELDDMRQDMTYQKLVEEAKQQVKADFRYNMPKE